MKLSIDNVGILMDQSLKEQYDKLFIRVNGATEQLDRTMFLFSCEGIIKKMGRCQSLNIMRGTLDIWAAAVIIVMARLNLLFRKQSKWYLTTADICNCFGISTSSASIKATQIIDACSFTLRQKQYVHPEVQESYDYQMESGEFRMKMLAAVKFATGPKLTKQEHAYIPKTLDSSREKTTSESIKSTRIPEVAPRTVEEMKRIHEQDKQARLEERKELERIRQNSSRPQNPRDSEQLSFF